MIEILYWYTEQNLELFVKDREKIMFIENRLRLRKLWKTKFVV